MNTSQSYCYAKWGERQWHYVYYGNNEPNKYITCYVFLLFLFAQMMTLVDRQTMFVSEKINAFRVVVAKAIEKIETRNFYSCEDVFFFLFYLSWMHNRK